MHWNSGYQKWTSETWIKLRNGYQCMCNCTSQSTLKVWNIKGSLKPDFSLSDSGHPWQVDFITINLQVVDWNLHIGTTVPLLYSQEIILYRRKQWFLKTQTSFKMDTLPMHLTMHTQYRKSNHLGRSVVATTVRFLKQKSIVSQAVQLYGSNLSGFRNAVLLPCL